MDARNYKLIFVMFLVAVVLTACAETAIHNQTPIEIQATATAIATRQHVDVERAEFGLIIWKVWQVTLIAGIWVIFAIGLRFALNHGLAKVEKPSMPTIKFSPPPMDITTPPPMPSRKPLGDSLAFGADVREVDVDNAPWLADAIDERVAGDD